MTSNLRRIPLRHGVAAAGAVIIVAVSVGVSRRGEEPASRIATTTPAAAVIPPRVEPPREPAAPVGDPAAAFPSPPAVRTVIGPGIAPPPAAAQPPQRIAPPAKPTPPEPPIRPRRLAPIAMLSTAEFAVGEIRVRLPGVAEIAPDTVCRDRDGQIWPCGRRALAAVRALVRGKTVECPLPEKVKRGGFVADCTLAGADLAERLVASGWARAVDRESGLGEVERQAETKGLGLHAATVPSAVDPFPTPGDVPLDATTAPLGAVGEKSRGAPLGDVGEKSQGAPLGAIGEKSRGAPLGDGEDATTGAAGGRGAPMRLGGETAEP